MTFFRVLVIKSITVILIIFNLYLVLPLNAQEQLNLDSLLKILPSAKADTNKVLLFISIGQQYEAGKPSEAKQYYLKADSLSKKLDYKTGIIKFISNYTYLLNVEGKFDSSIILNLQAIDLARNIGDSTLTGKSLINTATAYRSAGDLETANRYYLQGRSIFENNHDTTVLAQLYDILQVMYTDLHQYQAATEYGKKAVQYSRGTGDSYMLSAALVNLSNTLQLTERRETAATLLEEASKLAAQNGNIDLQGSILNNLANIYLQKGNYKLSKPYLDKALSLFNSIGSKEGEAIALRNTAFYYLQDQQPDIAKEYAEKGLTIARENNLRIETKNNLLLLSDIAAAQHNIPAYKRLRAESENLGYSILNDKLQTSIITLEKKYETEKKQLKIDELKNEQALQQLTIQQSKQFNYILTATSFALIAICLLLWRNFVQKRNLHRQNLRALKAEQALESKLLLEKERTRIATDMHDDMGTGLSRIRFLSEGIVLKRQKNEPVDDDISKIKIFSHDLINSMGEIVWALNEKNDVLSDLIAYTRSYAVEYLSQQHIRCSVIAPELLPETYVSGDFRRNVYLSVKEIIHNIVKHANATRVVIVISTDKILLFRIEDNGTGFNPEKIRPYSNGLANLKKRIGHLGGELNIDSEKGTIVQFSVPLE